nr:homogeneously-staining region [Tanacetum cinerariifolium]
MRQRKYAFDLLKYADALDVKPVATPMDPIAKLHEEDGEPLSDPITYRTIVGKRICLTLTRTDFSFAADALSQFSHNPRIPHLDALQRVLRYLKLCPGQGIYFPVSDSLELVTYYNSDWKSCQTTRRSVSGDMIRQSHIKPIFVSSQAQVANILTEGLNKYLHYNCLSKLNICDPYTVSTCGRGGIKELILLPRQLVKQVSIVSRDLLNTRYNSITRNA